MRRPKDIPPLSPPSLPGVSQGSKASGGGDVCPLDYRYRPADLDRPAQRTAETLYVVGGLYGNPEALEAVLAMAEAERREGREVTLVFNGDFNWFNVAPEDFARINEIVLAHTVIAGNVEAELGRGEAGENCGCHYPDYVGREVPERSDRIFRRLKETARGFPEVVARLADLPRHLTVAVGSHRVGILHGDADSLSGWSLAAEALAPPNDRALALPNDRALAQSERDENGCGDPGEVVIPTPRSEIERIFRASRMDALATTHTCLPFARDWTIVGGARLIINNGSAGMPNFRGRREGLLTRISVHPAVPPGSLYSLAWDGVRYDALPIAYDVAGWRRRFLRDWSPGSPAHASYFERIEHGPDFTLADAVRGTVQAHAKRD